ncbi:MAG: hypothetical protein NVSMB64_04130 [Candidatus Velthaea sp.]
MLGLPDRNASEVRFAVSATAIIVSGLLAYAGRLAPNPALSPLEFVPLGILAWLLPLWAALPIALAASVAAATMPATAATYSLANGFVVVMVALLRRRTSARIATSEAQYRAIGDAIPYGVWSASANGEPLYVSPSYLALRTRDENEDAIERALIVQGQPFEYEHEVAVPGGDPRWILTRGVPVTAEDRSLRSFVGINLDITDRKNAERSLAENEERYRYLAESIPQIVWICDAEARIEYFNERWYSYSGMMPGQPLSGAFSQRIHPGDRDRGFKLWISAGRSATETYEAELRLRAADGSYRWFLSRALAQTDRSGNVLRWFGTSTDIDARKRAEDQLAFLARASEALAVLADVESTCNVLAQLVVPSIADWCGVYLLEGDDAIRPVALAHDDAAALKRAWIMERRYRRTLSSPGILAQAMRTGELQTTDLGDPATRRAVSQDDTHARIIESLDLGATLCVPMRSGLRTIGAILLINRESRRLFEPQDYELGQELARRAAVVVENARAYDRERRVADALQAAFLPPRLPRIPGLHFDAVYKPGQSESSIGGDWYDAFQLADGRVALSIGDVAGRGLRAAVVMGRVREAIRAFALLDLSPAQIVSATERVLRLGEGSTMVTALIGVVDPLAHTFTFANAGHPPALLVRADGSVEPLVAEGIPLGIFDDVVPVERTIELPDDAMLVLYTDGLIEIERDVVSGFEALQAAAREVMHSGERTASEIYRRMVAKAPARDDVAVLTLLTRRLMREALELDLPAVPESARLVRAALERLADAHGLDADRRFALEVAVGEAVTNAIEHAYGIGDGRFAVRAAAGPHGLEVAIDDRGSWRGPREEGRGRGVPIMRALAHSVAIESTAAGTSVRMTFNDGVERSTTL